MAPVAAFLLIWNRKFPAELFAPQIGCQEHRSRLEDQEHRSRLEENNNRLDCPTTLSFLCGQTRAKAFNSPELTSPLTVGRLGEIMKNDVEWLFRFIGVECEQLYVCT